MSEQWSVSVSPHYKAEPEPSEEDKRACEYLELMLRDRIDELIAWARNEKTLASGQFLVGVKGTP